MHKIYQAGNIIDAQLVSDYLRTNGIDVTVTGMYLRGAMGELPVDAQPIVYINDERDEYIARKRMREILPEYSVDGDWHCPSCHETQLRSFEVCWQCGQVRPD